MVSPGVCPRLRLLLGGLLLAGWPLGHGLAWAQSPSGPAPAAASPTQLAQGRQLFLQGAVPSCAVCHTLADAGAEGAVGPVLDEIKPDAARVAKALRNGIGQMPTFRDKLSDEQIAALAAYVSQASGSAR